MPTPLEAAATITISGILPGEPPGPLFSPAGGYLPAHSESLAKRAATTSQFTTFQKAAM